MCTHNYYDGSVCVCVCVCVCTAIVCACVYVYTFCVYASVHVYVYKSMYFYNIVILHALCVLFPVHDIVLVCRILCITFLIAPHQTQ